MGERHYPIKVVCCDCGKFLRTKSGRQQPGLISHGYCDACLAKAEDEIEKINVSHILGIEPITVNNFPCMICRKKNATGRLVLQIKSAVIKLVVCPKCATMEAAEILLHIKEYLI